QAIQAEEPDHAPGEIARSDGWGGGAGRGSGQDEWRAVELRATLASSPAPGTRPVSQERAFSSRMRASCVTGRHDEFARIPGERTVPQIRSPGSGGQGRGERRGSRGGGGRSRWRGVGGEGPGSRRRARQGRRGEAGA